MALRGAALNPERAAATFAVGDCLCQSPSLIEKVAKLIGPDLILFDSEWLPDRWQPVEAETALESDAHRFPVDPPHGVTALIGASASQRELRSTLIIGCILVLPERSALTRRSGPEPSSSFVPKCPYRVRAAGGCDSVPSVYAQCAISLHRPATTETRLRARTARSRSATRYSITRGFPSGSFMDRTGPGMTS